MRTLFNHTLRSIRDSLGQLVIIILTVTVVSALFFVTLTIGGLFENVQTSIQSRLGKDSDVTATATVFSESEFDEFISGRNDVEYVEKYLQTAGLYKPADGSYNKVIAVEATDLKNYAARHGKELTVYESYEYSSDYPEVWIGRSFAEENAIKAGDSIDIYLEMYKTYRTLTVNYIFENYGIFANNVVNNVLADFSTIGNKGLISTANIKLTDGADKEAFMKELSDSFDGEITVEDSIDYGEIDRVVGSNKRLLRITLVFVTALMIFILFTSFLVVAKKRINELTVFKSVGATNGQIAGMLIFEGMFYGLTGAVLGTVLGRIGMGIAVKKVIPNFPDAISYTVTDYMLSILFGVAVSAISAVAPVIKAGRESVRTATADKAKAVKKHKILPLALSTASLVACAVATAVVSGNTVCVVLLVLAAAVFTYFATPYLVRLVSFVMKRKLSGITVKRNPSSNTLSGMVASVMVFTFVVLSIVNVIIGAVTPKNSRFYADFIVDSVTTADMESLRKELAEVYGVNKAFLYVYDTAIYDKGTQRREFTLYGVDNAEGLDGICRNLNAEDKRAFDSEINPVIITYDLANRFGLKRGDKINITLGTKEETGATLYDLFTVVGVDETVTSDDRLMVIRKDSFRVDGKSYEPKENIIFLYANKDVPTEDLYKDLRSKTENRGCYILGLDDWAYATSVGITGVKTLLRILQTAVSAVALIGVINLTAVTVMERKREYDVFRAAGMDKGKYVALSAGEGFIISLTGAFIGTALSVVVNFLMPIFAEIIDRYVDFSVFPWQLAAIAVAIVAGYTAVYTITALLRRKNTAVERNII